MNLRVGVCEDDAALRRVLRRALAGAGHETVTAHTGREALNLFDAAAGLDDLTS